MRAPHLAGRHSNSEGACPLDTYPPRYIRTPTAAQAGVRQHAGDIKRGMCTAQGIMSPCASRTAGAAAGVPVRYLLVSRGQAPCLLVCRPLLGLKDSAHDVRVERFGGEELVSLVMKTAPASGMKNSLALVVKNALRA